MGDPLKKVKTGDPLTIPAAAYNRFVDAAVDLNRRQLGSSRDAMRDPFSVQWVPVRNDSGANRSRFDVMTLQDPIILPSVNESAFTEQIAFGADTPVTGDSGRIAVLLESIPNGKIGRACIDGLCLVKVQMNDPAHRWADPDNGVTANLTSKASGGSAQLVWIEDPNAVTPTWCIARLGAPAAGTVLPGIIWGRVDSSAQDGTNRRFIYQITEYEKGTDDTGYGAGKWQVKSGGYTGDGFNMLEYANATTGMLGIGMTVEEIEDASCPYHLNPLPVGVITPFYAVTVPLTGGGEQTEYWCSVPNSVSAD